MQEWRRDVLQLQSDAWELVQEDRKTKKGKPATEAGRDWVELTEVAFSVLWAGFTPEVVFASACASLKADRPVLATQKVKAEGEGEVRIIREADPLPEPEPIEALVEEPEEIEEPEPEPIEEPTPEVEPEPEPEPEALPVVITEQQCCSEVRAAEPEPPAEPEPEPPAPPPSDGWLKAQDLAEVLGCSWGTILRNVREGLFDDHMRRPLPGEGRGKRFDPEACRAAVENRPDKRRRERPKPLRVSADALAADPALLEQLEQMLAAVKGES